MIGLSYPDIFITALTYAGGFSCAILFGLFPPIMAWVGRYIKKYPHDTRQLFGGRAMLALLILFVAIELGIEISKQFSWV